MTRKQVRKPSIKFCYVDVTADGRKYIWTYYGTKTMAIKYALVQCRLHGFDCYIIGSVRATVSRLEELFPEICLN